MAKTHYLAEQCGTSWAEISSCGVHTFFFPPVSFLDSLSTELMMSYSFFFFLRANTDVNCLGFFVADSEQGYKIRQQNRRVTFK